jgi:hypothetical protein
MNGNSAKSNIDMRACDDGNPERDKTQVDREIEQLQDAVSRCETLNASMRDRLAPVLRAGEGICGLNKEEEIVPLAATIRSIRYRVESMADDQESTLGRMEI